MALWPFDHCLLCLFGMQQLAPVNLVHSIVSFDLDVFDIVGFYLDVFDIVGFGLDVFDIVI